MAPSDETNSWKMRTVLEVLRHMQKHRYRTIAKASSYSVGTTYKVVQELAEHGYIRIESDAKSPLRIVVLKEMEPYEVG